MTLQKEYETDFVTFAWFNLIFLNCSGSKQVSNSINSTITISMLNVRSDVILEIILAKLP